MREILDLPPGQEGRVWWLASSRGLHPRHTHAELECNLVVAGRARYLVGTRRYDLAPGSLVWLFPEQDHVLVDQSAGLSMWIAVFTPRLVRGCAAPEALRAGDPPGHFARTVAREECDDLATLLADIAEAGAARANAGLGYLLHRAWAVFEAAASAPDEAAVHPAVQHAARVLREESATLPDLAARVGLSPSRLSRVFRRQTGVSITDFRNRQRVDRFLRIYGGGRTTLTDAALRAGFGSYPQFHRVYTRLAGQPPHALRRAPSRPPGAPG